MVVTWCGGSEVVLAGAGGGDVCRVLDCGDGGDVVETAMVMAAAKAMVVRSKGKLAYLEQPFIPLAYPVASQAARDAYNALYDAQNEVDVLCLKDKRKTLGAKGKDNGKNKLAYAPKPKIPLPPKRDILAKDSVCHHCKEVGHWRRKCPSYQAELKKRKISSMASTSGIFSIELYAFPNKTWVYDTGCGTYICNTSQGLRGSKKLKHKALSLYMGNGMRTTIKAIGSFDLIHP
ncbi:zinc finger, CCHC-type containing protein [Tanacetum coccineum]